MVMHSYNWTVVLLTSLVAIEQEAAMLECYPLVTRACQEYVSEVLAQHSKTSPAREHVACSQRHASDGRSV